MLPMSATKLERSPLTNEHPASHDRTRPHQEFTTVLNYPYTERVLLTDDRLVRPWWKKKEVTPPDVDTQDGDQPKRRRWAPGMKFDEQGSSVNFTFKRY